MYTKSFHRVRSEDVMIFASFRRCDLFSKREKEREQNRRAEIKRLYTDGAAGDGSTCVSEPMMG